MFSVFIVLIFISGCTSSPKYNNPVPVDPNQKYLDNPLYCEKDSDCTKQETSCVCPGCDANPINVYNFKQLDCTQAPAMACDRMCLDLTPKCQNNQCVLVSGSCTSDSQCQEGFSCWYQIPAGPSAGIKGSIDNPGNCVDNKTIELIV